MRENGTYVNSIFGGCNQKLMFSLLSSEENELIPGNYILMIDPIWDESADLDEKYRDIVVSLIGPE